MFLFWPGMSSSDKTCQAYIKYMTDVPSVLNVLIPNPACTENTNIMIPHKCTMLNFSKNLHLRDQSKPNGNKTLLFKAIL